MFRRANSRRDAQWIGLGKSRTDKIRSSPARWRRELGSRADRPRDPFSVHVFACLVTLAAQEAIASGATIGETLGLRSADSMLL